MEKYEKKRSSHIFHNINTFFLHLANKMKKNADYRREIN